MDRRIFSLVVVFEFKEGVNDLMDWLRRIFYRIAIEDDKIIDTAWRI